MGNKILRFFIVIGLVIEFYREILDFGLEEKLVICVLF